MNTSPGNTPPVAWLIPEEIGPAPGLEFGAPGPRLLAYIVDAVIVGIVITVIVILATVLAVTGASNADSGTAIASVLLGIVAIFVVSLGYFPWFWSRSGATPGMALFHLRVVRDADGGPISTGQAILRLIGYWVSGVVFYLGYVWIFVDKRKRGWHDLIAGTVVVHDL